MLDFQTLDTLFTVEYQSNIENVPLYISRKNIYEEGIPERCVSFNQAVKLVKNKKLFFTAGGPTYKSSWDVAIQLNSLLDVKNCYIPRMVYYKAKKVGTKIFMIN